MRRPSLLFVPLALLVLQSLSFELQDTIHALIEENIHLHDQLENLTQALRELKRMLWRHSNGITVWTFCSVHTRYERKCMLQVLNEEIIVEGGGSGVFFWVKQ